MRTRLLTTTLLALGVALSACGEKPQAMGKRKSDEAAYTGAQAAYTAGTWKAGDAAAWEAQLKTRSQSQNEYARDAAP